MRAAISDEFRLAIAPDETYARMLSQASTRHAGSLTQRIGMVLVVIATLSPIMAVNRVTLGLVANGIAYALVALTIQLAASVAVIAASAPRGFGLVRALDFWFAGHLPYSLWIVVGMALAGTAPAGSMLTPLEVSVVIPAALTARITYAFFRTALGGSPQAALFRTIAHFVLLWGMTLTYIAWIAGGWFQLLP